MVKTNVNFQVVGVLVFQKVTKDMLKKGLQTICDWNPTVTPKFGMVDFNEKEINALEELFSAIVVFICSFHHEQALPRWTSKSEHNASHITNDVKCRLRRIAHTSSREELDKSIEDFLSWEHFTGNLKVWFTKKWLPEIKGWAVYFIPDQLMLTNTNNGTERLNHKLKTKELVDYKKCSLYEMLKVVTESFLPSLYHRYVELNIRYSNECEKGHYQST